MGAHLAGMPAQLAIFLSVRSLRLGWVRQQYYNESGLKQPRKTNVRWGQGRKVGLLVGHSGLRGDARMMTHECRH